MESQPQDMPHSEEAFDPQLSASALRKSQGEPILVLARHPGALCKLSAGAEATCKLPLVPTYARGKWHG
jgi:hypothetical protein